MKLFIGCSSSNDIDTAYEDDCKLLLEDLLKENELVFGASNSGLMGLSYNIALATGEKITGICPKAYQDDFKQLNCTTEITTTSISERTDKLISLSDALIFLPGGIGTIYELFAAIESKRSHEFDKPIIIYNSRGYFDPLLTFLEKMYAEKFSNSKDKANYLVANKPREVLYYLNNYQNLKKNESQFGLSYEIFCDYYNGGEFNSKISDFDNASKPFIRLDDSTEVTIKKTKK